MKAAIARLEISLETLTTNEPIHRAEGNIEQADMEKANIAEIKQALELLKAADTAQPSQESCPNLRISASPTEAPYCADCGKKFVGEKPSETPQEIQIAVLEGEMELHHDELGWWAKELDFWRCKYLREHPEHDNWEYVRNARKDEEARGY